MPPAPAEHGTTNRWRTGDRCTDCRCAHNTDSRTYRRHLAEVAFPAAARTQLLRLIRRGSTVVEAAEQIGVTTHAVYARRRYDHRWAERLDKALTVGRDPDVPHGTESGYRTHGCRCPECRAAHHPTGGVVG